MTEAILTLGIFAVPILTVAVIEQRKTEKERKVREIARILEEEKQKKAYLATSKLNNLCISNQNMYMRWLDLCLQSLDCGPISQPKLQSKRIGSQY